MFELELVRVERNVNKMTEDRWVSVFPDPAYKFCWSHEFQTP